jgi:high-affinity Fe2+/Pb2+ permease
MSKSISRKGAKKTKQFSFASLCALASLREIVYFFTALVGRE